MPLVSSLLSTRHSKVRNCVRQAIPLKQLYPADIKSKASVIGSRLCGTSEHRRRRRTSSLLTYLDFPRRRAGELGGATAKIGGGIEPRRGVRERGGGAGPLLRRRPEFGDGERGPTAAVAARVASGSERDCDVRPRERRGT